MASSVGPTGPQFPAHSAPRVWLLTSGRSPVAIALARQLLAHGDMVAAGVRAQDFDSDDERDADLKLMLSAAGESARERVRLVDLDIRYGCWDEVRAIVCDQERSCSIRFLTCL